MSQQINLFNPIFLKQKKYFSAATMAQALALIFVGSAVLGVYGSYRFSALTKEAEASAAQLAAVQAKFNKISAGNGPRQKSKALEEELQKAEVETKAMQQVLAVMQKGEFGNTAGYAEYMRAFSRQIMSGVWLTGFAIYGAGTDISLQGRALKPDLIPAYLTRLKQEPVLKGKSFSAFELQAPQNGAKKDAVATAAYVEFSLQSSGLIKDQQAERKPNAEAAPFATANAYLDAMRAAGAAMEWADAAGAKGK